MSLFYITYSHRKHNFSHYRDNSFHPPNYAYKVAVILNLSKDKQMYRKEKQNFATQLGSALLQLMLKGKPFSR